MKSFNKWFADDKVFYVTMIGLAVLWLILVEGFSPSTESIISNEAVHFADVTCHSYRLNAVESKNKFIEAGDEICIGKRIDWRDKDYASFGECVDGWNEMSQKEQEAASKAIQQSIPFRSDLSIVKLSGELVNESLFERKDYFCVKFSKDYGTVTGFAFKGIYSDEAVEEETVLEDESLSSSTSCDSKITCDEWMEKSFVNETCLVRTCQDSCSGQVSVQQKQCELIEKKSGGMDDNTLIVLAFLALFVLWIVFSKRRR